MWKMINRERIRKKEIKERIKMEEWERHFREILGDVEWRDRSVGKKGGW